MRRIDKTMRQIMGRSESSAWIQWLIGAIAAGLVSSLAAPVQAEDSFGNEVVQFPVDTTVEFEFKESHGAYQSTIGVVNLDTGEETVLFKEVKPYDDYGTGKAQTRQGQNSIGTSLD